MKYSLRPYQQEAVDSVYQHLRQREDNPCVVLPTGTGKSLVLGQIATDAVTRWSGRVLILAHVKELLQQNAEKIKTMCPQLDIGVYSAGLRRRDTHHAVVVAGIQSVFRRACELGAFNLIIIDEVHMLPPDGEGMYRTFLADAKIVNPKVRLIGLTATPFRLKGGMICQQENLLNHVCYDAGIKEMIVQGYLANLRSRGGVAKPNLENVHIRGGEFVAAEAAEAMDKKFLVSGACSEIIDLTQQRKSVLIFTASVEHCRHVAEEITARSGQECAIITGETHADERAEILARFKGEQGKADLFGNKKPPLKFLANVNVLTTGFDATNIDCVVLLRPTASAGLYVQMVGRGARTHPGKEDCLILDYGENVMRHGPVDSVMITSPRAAIGGPAPARECVECHAIVHAAYRACPECGHEFPPPQTYLCETASDDGILSGEVTKAEHSVQGVEYGVHEKRGAEASTPKTMRVEYQVALNDWVSEWVCPEHTGYAREKFEKWWKDRSVCPMPNTAQEAVILAKDGALAKTKSIIVRRTAGDFFSKILSYEIEDKPEYELEPGWNDLVGATEQATSCEDFWGEIPF